jgi:hypothetical protein
MQDVTSVVELREVPARLVRRKVSQLLSRLLRHPHGLEGLALRPVGVDVGHLPPAKSVHEDRASADLRTARPSARDLAGDHDDGVARVDELIRLKSPFEGPPGSARTTS